MSEIAKDPHEKEEEVSQAYEKGLAIERNKPQPNTTDEDFLPDPSEATGSESLGGGYGSTLPATPARPSIPASLADQLPTKEHTEAARRNIGKARKALNDAVARTKKP